ncbi:MAG: hypothetical protein J6Y32_07180 [Bacteroidales bacterium]|nr:hypothetical protein [Bacteroidales bacterium]
MKRFFFFLLSAFFCLSLKAADETVSATDKGDTIKMGQVYGSDKARSRSFPKRLFSPKGSWGIGFQGTWLGARGTNSSVVALLTGLNGSFSFGRIAPAATYTYMDNAAVGLRFTYIGASGKIDGGALQLMDVATLDLSGTGLKLRSYGASVFHRNWWGIDERGRFAVFLDAALSYLNTNVEMGGRVLSQRVAFSVSPGFEVFVMNFLSLNLSVGLISFSYDWDNNYKSDGTWSGDNKGVHLGTGLSLLDINFGLNFYF